MHATIRRYEGVDQNRIVELNNKVSESLIPKLNELPGFVGYYLIEADNGVITSLGLFEKADQADESGRIAATWIRDERLETTFPNAPKVTSGRVIAHQKSPMVVA
jgi:hypothetical protein